MSRVWGVCSDFFFPCQFPDSGGVQVLDGGQVGTGDLFSLMLDARPRNVSSMTAAFIYGSPVSLVWLLAIARLSSLAFVSTFSVLVFI